MRRLRETGIDPQDFERARRAAYGRYISLYGGIESMAGMLVLSKFADFGAYELLDVIADLTVDDAQAFLREFTRSPRYPATECSQATSFLRQHCLRG